ncbi:MAG: glutamate-1-semialdehyde 2,1-aminomutase [Candidatus Omnitrophica bacterium]|nr:glutamate-1-semialdehyde 2,1-aminomutase [Candidatus Omnitrophota bacterium]
MAGVGIAKDLLNDAKRFIPGGVNSPVRSFKAVGGYPVFVKRGSGSKLYGECGGEFIDYCLSWGTMILGHAYPEVTKALEKAVKDGTSFGAATTKETELARLIVEAIPSVEQVRLTSSGTEAVMSAIRLARGYTKRNKIIKFEGAYHGHADYLLVKSGSGAATLSMPDSLGVPKDFTKHTIVAPYNDIEETEKIAEKYKEDLAAIIVEPVAGNCGVIPPEAGFLKGLRKIADQHGALLIFDEVITGFRYLYGGAQALFGIIPDITCLGKIIGGGLPVGAFGGRKDVISLLAPQGGVYQAGTLSGNPIAVKAGITTLNILKEKNPYAELKNKTEELCEGIEKIAAADKIALRVNRVGSMFSVFFTNEAVVDYRTAKKQDTDSFKRFFHGLLKQGIYFSPSGFEANFLSLAHSKGDIEKTLEVISEVLKK